MKMNVVCRTHTHIQQPTKNMGEQCERKQREIPHRILKFECKNISCPVRIAVQECICAVCVHRIPTLTSVRPNRVPNTARRFPLFTFASLDAAAVSIITCHHFYDVYFGAVRLSYFHFSYRTKLRTHHFASRSCRCCLLHNNNSRQRPYYYRILQCYAEEI